MGRIGGYSLVVFAPLQHCGRSHGPPGDVFLASLLVLTEAADLLGTFELVLQFLAMMAPASDRALSDILKNPAQWACVDLHIKPDCDFLWLVRLKKN